MGGRYFINCLLRLFYFGGGALLFFVRCFGEL